jgi:high-affinity iron transporter
MLDAVLLVLREVLEAALFVSLLLALGARLGLAWRWERIAIPLGLLASWLSSRMAGELAEAFEGTGQELLNAALYLTAIVSFIAIDTLLVPAMAGRPGGAQAKPRTMYALFVLIVICSMAREGSEVWIYLSSFVGNPSAMSAAVTGGLIGTGIGLSLCALVYYAFSFLGRRTFLATFFVLAVLVVGGLSMQLAKLGLQTGWLDSGRPVWDTSWLVSERSWLGQLLHALFGYDANPDSVQAAFYFAALLAVAAGAALQWLRHRIPRHA